MVEKIKSDGFRYFVDLDSKVLHDVKCFDEFHQCDISKDPSKIWILTDNNHKMMAEVVQFMMSPKTTEKLSKSKSKNFATAYKNVKIRLELSDYCKYCFPRNDPPFK